MATVARSSRQGRLNEWGERLRAGFRRAGELAAGAALIAVALAVALALVTYHPSDPAINTAAAGPVLNWAGDTGAYASDLLLSLFGPPVALLVPLVALFGLRVGRGAGLDRWKRALGLTLLGVVLAGAGAALLIGGAVNGLPAGWGGALGLTLARIGDLGFAAIGEPAIAEPFRIVVIALLFLGALFLAWLGLGLQADERQWILARRMPRARRIESRYAVVDDDDVAELADKPARPAVTPPAEPRRTVISEPKVAAEPGRRPQRERQQSLALGDAYRLPPLDLLEPAPPPINQSLDKAGLERNARLLESVLEDFSVRGEIVEVRPGPVVTMYELEPASGTKASRVINLYLRVQAHRAGGQIERESRNPDERRQAHPARNVGAPT